MLNHLFLKGEDVVGHEQIKGLPNISITAFKQFPGFRIVITVLEINAIAPRILVYNNKVIFGFNGKKINYIILNKECQQAIGGISQKRLRVIFRNLIQTILKLQASSCRKRKQEFKKNVNDIFNFKINYIFKKVQKHRNNY